MTITNEAKLLLGNLFESNDEDCLKIELKKTEKGSSLLFNLVKLGPNDKPIYINDIPVLMDELVLKRSKTVTISVTEGDLVINDPTATNCC